MISTIIIDDEPIAVKHLAALIKKYCPQLEVRAAASCVKEALDEIELVRPELVLLDIELGTQSSFELLQQSNYRNFELIFVTAHERFGIQAIRENATDYLLKPIIKTELIAAVEKAAEKIYRKRAVETRGQKDPAYTSRLALPASDGLLFVDTASIIYCESEGRYTRFYMADNKKILVTKNLGEYEAILPQHLFVRIHHHCIINLRYAERYVKGRGGYVVLTNGTALAVSSRKKDDFLSNLLQ